MLLEGVLTAATTCFTGDGKLFLHKLERNVERYSRTAISGIVMLGSTGEAVMLSDEESRLVLRTAIEAAAPHKVMIAGIGRESVSETLRLAEYAATQQFDAVLVRTPHFYRPQLRTTEMLHYYRSVADASPLPVLLYSIPSYTLYDLPVSLVAELAHHPNIIGMKDSSGNVERIAQLVEATAEVAKRKVMVTQTFAAVTRRMLKPENSSSQNEASGELVQLQQTPAFAVAAVASPSLKTRTRDVGFQVIGGSAQTMLPAFQAGATAAILAMAAFAPQSCAEVHMAWKEQDEVLQKEKQNRLIEAASCICGVMGIPGVKFACDQNGYYGGIPRPPLLPLTAKEQQTASLLLADLRS